MGKHRVGSTADILAWGKEREERLDRTNVRVSQLTTSPPIAAKDRVEVKFRVDRHTWDEFLKVCREGGREPDQMLRNAVYVYTKGAILMRAASAPMKATGSPRVAKADTGRTPRLTR